MSTLLENAQTGTEIQIWIDVRLPSSSDEGERWTLLVLGYPNARALVPMIGYQFRTSQRLSGSVAVVVLQHPALAFAAPDRAFIFEFFRRWLDELVVQALVVPFGVIVFHEILDGSAKVSLAEELRVAPGGITFRAFRAPAPARLVWKTGCRVVTISFQYWNRDSRESS